MTNSKPVKLTPRKVAKAIGVSESSMKRWCDRGLIPFEKTVGGHRRISRHSVFEFIRNGTHQLVNSEALGLPPGIRSGRRELADMRVDFDDSLMAGDADRAARVVMEVWLGGHSVAEIGDRLVTPAFQRFLVNWKCEENPDSRQKQACEAAVQALDELRKLLPQPGDTAPLAVGGTTGTGKDQPMPGTIVEMVLEESGWRTRSLGDNVALSALVMAYREDHPKLIWLSIDDQADEGELNAKLSELRQSVNPGTFVAVNGPPTSARLVENRQGMRFSANLQQLESLASSLQNGRTAWKGHTALGIDTANGNHLRSQFAPAHNV